MSFQPPPPNEKKFSDHSTECDSADVPMNLFAAAGGIIAFFGCNFLGLTLESYITPSEPSLSYGKQAFFLTLPICTMIGAFIGFGIALYLVGRRIVSLLTLILVSYGGWCITSSTWNDQIERYGRDPSEIILYYPPMAFSVLALNVALAICLITIFSWGWRMASFSRIDVPE